MNKCEKWTVCPLGDLAKSVGCRKPWCPGHPTEEGNVRTLTVKETVVSWRSRRPFRRPRDLFTKEIVLEKKPKDR
ncbi:MAG: hypothetical protein LUQ09_05015 [Methanomassiliicoccales archaeon]|nr:hypothetical protein [Methanomassiliicoccales archaeon]